KWWKNLDFIKADVDEYDGKKLLLWLDPCTQPLGIFEGLQGVGKPAHIRKALEMQYWSDRDGLHLEAIMSDTYLAPLEPEKLSKMMDILNACETHFSDKAHSVDCETTPEAPTRDQYEPFIVVAAHSQFFNFHGEREARLDADQSIYACRGFEGQKSTLIFITDMLLFCAPSSYSRELKRVWVDEIVNPMRWRAFMDMLTTEWAGYTIYAKYMQEMTSFMIGTDYIAIMYSVPFSLLMWAYVCCRMLSYLVCLASVIFNSKYTPTLVTASIGAVIIGILVVWPAWPTVLGLKQGRKVSKLVITSDDVEQG
ncbi:hypothetical protein ID866_8163, partial [Astraeus odoratus]